MPSNEFYPHIDHTTEMKALPVGNVEKCLICGTPYKPTRKWNSGNPVDVPLSQCNCEEEAAMQEVLDRFKDREEQRKYRG